MNYIFKYNYLISNFKGIPIPSHEFVKRKKLELSAAQKEIEIKNIAPTPTKTRITRTDLGKII